MISEEFYDRDLTSKEVVPPCPKISCDVFITTRLCFLVKYLKHFLDIVMMHIS